MVLAPKNEQNLGVEELVAAVMEHCVVNRVSPDQREYWGGRREDETWSAYVDRMSQRRYSCGLSYENGC